MTIDNFTFSPQRADGEGRHHGDLDQPGRYPAHRRVAAHSFRSKALDTDDKFSFTFTTPGTYKYFCSLHPHMTGTIVVEAATGSNDA